MFAESVVEFNGQSITTCRSCLWRNEHLDGVLVLAVGRHTLVGVLAKKFIFYCFFIAYRINVLSYRGHR